jgi:hypothetical protein
MSNQKLDTKQWQRRKGATDARIAMLLAETERRANVDYDAYFDRLKALLGHEGYVRLLDAWQAEQVAPADLAAIIEADPDARRLYSAAARAAWALESTKHSGIISEHYVYEQTGGKLIGPNGER